MRIIDNNSLPGGAGDQSRVNAQRGQEASKSADAQKAEKAQAAKAGVGGAGESGHNDRVQLSGLAAALRTETSTTPEREAKIDRLAREVESGRYRVDSKSVARRMIDDAFQK